MKTKINRKDGAVKYLFAIILPPTVLFAENKPIQGIINIFLCFAFWIPAVIHALISAFNEDQESRHEELLEALKGRNKI